MTKKDYLCVSFAIPYRYYHLQDTMFPQYYISIALFLKNIGISEDYLALTVTVTLWLATFACAGLAYWLITRPIGYVLKRWADRTPTKWDDYLLTDEVFRAIGVYVFLIILYNWLPDFFLYYRKNLPTLIKLLRIMMTIGTVYLVCVAANVTYDACERQKLDRHGMLVLRNLVRTIAVTVGVLVAMSIILNRNVTYILSGLGAMAAVLTLVFKDTILGLVAGIKLSANKSLKKGDWIQVPSFGANGEVIDVSLTAVKVLNWDNSVVSVPPYALISGGFQNQQEMKRSGGRRIMRSLLIDLSSVRYLPVEDLSRFKGEEWVKDFDLSVPQVNLTLFRAFLEHHILSARGFRDDMLNMVRELEPTPQGIPVEIYLFTSAVNWKEFEKVQADLMDSILAAVSLFGLRLFQSPSGADFRTYANNTLQE